MRDTLRREVLQVFKKLHRTRMTTFRGDEHALQVVRTKINGEYKKNKGVTNSADIEQLNKFAQEVELEIRRTVIRAVEKEPGTFVLEITPDTELMDNDPTKDFNNQCNNTKNSNLKQTEVPEDKKK